MVEIKNDGMMWALVKEKPEEGLWMKRVPIPEVGPNDVKIKIHKTAICGTDVHIYQWNEWAQHTIPVGLTAGHEYVGEVVEVGEGVQGFKIGYCLFIDFGLGFVCVVFGPESDLVISGGVKFPGNGKGTLVLRAMTACKQSHGRKGSQGKKQERLFVERSRMFLSE